MKPGKRKFRLKSGKVVERTVGEIPVKKAQATTPEQSGEKSTTDKK